MTGIKLTGVPIVVEYEEHLIAKFDKDYGRWCDNCNIYQKIDHECSCDECGTNREEELPTLNEVITRNI